MIDKNCQTCEKSSSDLNDWGDCPECVTQYKLCERCEEPIPEEEPDLCEHCTDEGFISQSHADAIYEQIKYGESK